MIVYRIVREKYSDSLMASGRQGRWNFNDEFVLYTAASRSLATLELLVHRSGIQSDEGYIVLSIEIGSKYESISPQQLPASWKSLQHYSTTQTLGSEWYHNETSLILRVPSVIIPREQNFIINTSHKDFGSVQIIEKEPYFWDERLGG